MHRYPSISARSLIALCCLAQCCLAIIPGLVHAEDKDAIRKSRQSTIIEHLERELPALVKLYKHFHAHPELSLEEEQTSRRLALELKQAGFEVTERFGGHGVVALLRNGPGPTILVRADMDGLPIIEDTGLDYQSNVRTRNQEGLKVGVMHACGHDVNITCLVGTARVMAALKNRWQGTLLFIGQPAEEIGAGAKAMIDAGLLTKFPRPNFGLALHCDGRYPHGHVNYRVGQTQSNVDSVDITLRGRGGHGSAPQTTIDPIVLAARLVLDLQTLVSRETSPLEPAVVTVGSIHAGTKPNIIPNECKLQLTVRTVNDRARKRMLEGIARLATAASKGAGAPPPVVRVDPTFTPAMFNDPKVSEQIAAVFRDTLGDDKVHVRPMSMGGEDFAHFGLAGIRTFYYWLGTVPPERYRDANNGGKPLASTHSPFYYPVPEPTLRTGVLTMSMALLELAGKK